jgi:AraC family transcriptional regulator
MRPAARRRICVDVSGETERMSRTGELSQARIHAHQRAEGFAVQLRSDSSGVLEVPGMDSALVSIHIGKAARMSCRRAGTSHTGSAVHGDIDIIPVGVPSV